MSVFRPTYHSPIYEPATYSTRNGKRFVRFRLPKSGKYVTGEVTASGKARIQQSTYVARIRKDGRTVRVALGVEDREAALQLRAKLQLAADQNRAGTIDPYAEARATPLYDQLRDYAEPLGPKDRQPKDHLWNYKEHLEASGYTPEWIGESIGCILRTMKTLHWQYSEQLHSPQLERYLSLLIKQGRSYRTRNKYLQQVKAFVHWMQNNNLLDGDDPFRNIKALNQDCDKNRRFRRVISAEEATKLCKAASVGPIVQGISGTERALLYAFAMTTGLRAKEIALLQVRDLVLDADPPYVVPPAGITKAKREDTLPIHPSIAAKLKDWVNTYQKNDRVFHLMTEKQTGGKGGKLRLTHRMMQADCKASGVPYQTVDGFADFHAWRTTYISNCCRLTDQFTAMKLARHTKATITARHYDKVLIGTRAEVVAALPAPSDNAQSPVEQEVNRRTEPMYERSDTYRTE